MLLIVFKLDYNYLLVGINRKEEVLWFTDTLPSAYICSSGRETDIYDIRKRQFSKEFGIFSIVNADAKFGL